ncbi:MAG: dodecin family protein [Thermodesulfobacteriota bacterium]
MSSYQFIELVGTSTKSWEDATRQAIDDAKAIGMRELRVGEVVRMDVKMTGALITFRVRLQMSYKVSSLKEFSKMVQASAADPGE